MTDPALMKRVAKGDSVAFRNLFDRHQAKVFGLAKAIANDRLKAEAVSQEVWMKVINDAPAYAPTTTEMTPWLLEMVRAISFDALKASAGAPEEDVRPEHRDLVLATAEKNLEPYRAKRRRFILAVAGAGITAAAAVLVKIKIIDGPPAIEPAALQAGLMADLDLVKELDFFEDLRDASAWQEN